MSELKAVCQNNARIVPLILIGPFPPPVHGMATTNAAVFEHMRALGAAPVVINTAPPSLDRAWVVRLTRAFRVWRGLVLFIRMRGARGGTLYASVSGGLGQLHEISFVAVARWRHMRIYLRHCSFAYLDKPHFISWILVKAAGSLATHVTQCQSMAERLKSLYRAPRVIAVSNAVLYPRHDNSSTPLRQKPHTLGFISNISAEKGVFDFLDLMAAVATQNLPLFGKLAGPFQDARTEASVRDRLACFHNVEYVGPQYGDGKERFFEGIDVLIFPTRYKNETEAKVNHEAMRIGIPVIAYGRGCIPEIVGADCGKVIDPREPFVPEALAQIRVWLEDPPAFEAASRAAARRFTEAHSQNLQRWRALLAEIIGGSGKASWTAVRTETQ